MASFTENDHAAAAEMLQDGLRQPLSGQTPAVPSAGYLEDFRPGWEVKVHVGEHYVTRMTRYHGSHKSLATCGIPSEEVIWPTWPANIAEELAVTASPLTELEKYWHTAGNRLRESAKWMATVLGAAMATVGSARLTFIPSGSAMGISLPALSPGGAEWERSISIEGALCRK